MIPYFSLNEINVAGITLQVWGSCVAIGIILALTISLQRAKRRKIRESLVWDVLILAVLGMIIGGKIFYMIFAQNGDTSFISYEGFSLMGGAIVAGIFSFFYLKRKKVVPEEFYDAMVPGVVIALIVTRIGCFLIGDHIGKITSLPWGREFIDGSIRHPIALYHILFLSAILIIIYRIEDKLRHKGALFLTFCLFYAIFRFLADFFRCSDLDFCDWRYYGMTATQWVISGFLLFSIFYLPKLKQMIK